MRSEHVSVVVACRPEKVYALASDPEALPRWAAGLAASPVTVSGDELLVDSPMGEVRVRFVPRNTWGVLDHVVRLPDGTEVLNPMRVVAHPDGAEVVFTVRQLNLTDDELAADVAAVRADLVTLKALLEG